VERARAIASERRIQNVSFSVANIYHLPFPAHTFDAVFAHAVLMFTNDPVAA
jgi:ubiquinone/menaquinone biosynthesis C-methylase UbiE